MRLPYQFLLLLGLSLTRGLFGFWPIHPLFGIIVFLQVSSKSTIIRKRFLTIALLVGIIYELIDPIQPVGSQLIASMGAFLAMREAKLKIDPPEKFTIPIFVTLYTFVFELTIMVICLHYAPSGVVLFKRLIILPFLDGLFSFLWFILPKYVTLYVNKRQKTQHIDA